MYRFLWTPRWILSHVLVLALIVGMILAMFWQIRRLDEKKELNALISSRADGAPVQVADALDRADVRTTADGDRVEYLAVVVNGTYDAAAEFTIPNRTLNGAAGRLVVTPLRFDGDRTILVLRGFIPQAVDDDVAPIDGIEPPTGEVQVRGWLRTTELPGAFQGDDVRLGDNRIARMDIDRIARARDLDLEPVYLDLGAQAPPTPSEAITPFPLPERTEGPHLGYAVQWAIFTLIAAGGYPLVIRRVARGGAGGKSDVPDEPAPGEPASPADRSASGEFTPR